MNCVVALMIGLISLAVVRGAAATGHDHEACTERELLLLSLRLDPMCFQNVEVIDYVLEAYNNATLASGGIPSNETIDIANELEEFLDDVCTDTCFGAIADFLSECTLFNDDGFSQLNIELLCSSNGEYRCPLLPSEISNATLIGSASFCIFYVTGTDPANFTCDPICNGVVSAFLSETGCCGTEFLNTLLQVASNTTNATIDDYYTACGIQDPGDCSLDIKEGNLNGNDILDGDCTRDQLLKFFNSFDATCDNNTNQLEPLFEEYFDSFETGVPNLEVVDTLDVLLPEVCTDTCVGALVDLFSECTPNFTTPREVEAITDACSHNGDFYCALAPFKADDLSPVTLLTAVDCSLDWLNDEGYECSAACKDATDTVVDQIGCCTTSILNLVFEDQNATVTAAGYYQSCGVDGTDGCLASFQDSSGIKMLASVALIFVAAVISAIF